VIAVKASVVVPTFNKLPLVLQTLDGLERQDVPPDLFEVIVVDDASSDGTSQALKNLKRPYDLKVIRHEKNKGRALARNSAVRAAGGRIIVFLDDDMETSPNFVSSHIDAHKNDDKLVVIGDVKTHPRANGSAVSRYLDTRGAQKIRSRTDLPFRYFSTNNASVAKEHLEAVGLFDEEFSTYGFEDVEIAARLSSERGLRFVFCEGAAALHLHKHTLKDFLDKKVLAGRSSLKLLLRKHPHLWSQVGLEMVETPRPLREPPRLSLKKIAFRALNAISFYGPAERVVRDTTLYPLTNLLLDYLVVRCYWIGMDRPRDLSSVKF
jgi:glycosyltransferase involved in cell wall biosynthesis